MYRNPKTTGFWWGRLPHWEVEEGRYFITIHLAGAIPASAMEQIYAKILRLKNQTYPNQTLDALNVSRSVFRYYEAWLDRAEVSKLLTVPTIAEMMREAIDHRVRIGTWMVYEYVIMPNHLHLFLSVLRGTLKESLNDFKRWTGHQAAKLTALHEGRFWQDEWFDHWSRSNSQDERIAAYIRHNPVKAGYVKHFQEWPYGSWSV